MEKLNRLRRYFDNAQPRLVRHQALSPLKAAATLGCRLTYSDDAVRQAPMRVNIRRHGKRTKGSVVVIYPATVGRKPRRFGRSALWLRFPSAGFEPFVTR
jgi:hypothetical protein